ncbi:hypothetical protein Gpo141_00002733 [Globisporangium polare]
MNSLPTSTSSTSASNSNMSATAAASGSSAAAAAGASHPSHANTRWKPASSAHSNVNTYRNMILLEKKRKSHEVAVGDMSNALLEETLAGLRGKARDLQNDKWMYEDVHI